MIIRLRSRDGLERIDVPDNSTVGDLKRTIHEKLSIPLDDMILSQDPALLTTKSSASQFQDMSNQSSTLSSLSITHGSIVHLLYSTERIVPGVKLSEFDKRPFGAHMTVEKMVSLQTRIEHQETPKCTSVSFDVHAANAFQSYVQSALAFSIKRGGLLYGTVNEEDKSVSVHAIFEPPQEGSAHSVYLERGTADELAADAVADALGWKKVGWIFTQSTKERDFVCSAEEICQMAAIQAELGETAVTGIVALFPAESDDDMPEVHFEAFQVSEQCVSLYQQGWFGSSIGGSIDSNGVDSNKTSNGSNGNDKESGVVDLTSPSTTKPTTTNNTTNTHPMLNNTINSDAPTTGTLTLRNPKEPKNKTPVILAGKDAGEVDSDFFLVPVAIKDHEGPLLTIFPIENRLLPQGKSELKAHLQKLSAKPYVERLSDFHLLCYLARQPGFEPNDVVAVVGAVARKEPVSEGYTLIIDSLAGM